MPYLNTSLFNRFPPVEISEDLWSRLQGDRASRQFMKKAFLTEQAQPIEHMIIVKQGCIKAMFMSADGNEFIFEILEAPAVFGYQALFSDVTEQWYPTLQALTKVEAVFVPIREVEQLVDEDPGLLKCFYKCLLGNVVISSTLSFWSQRLNMLQKVAFALSLTGNIPKDKEGYVRITHENLANFIGITRGNVTLSLSRLYEMGLIDKKHGKIKIKEQEAFHAFINSVVKDL